ncbi:MAG: AbrB/MazE/SpoVT family DNA-binding domain-containing protein [Methanothrix sp.]
MVDLQLGTRRVQVINGSAFLCLPSTWVKSLNVEKGDRIFIGLREDGALELYLQKRARSDR